jgi:small neutral amino acid transporter SnatA (MarC family)
MALTNVLDEGLTMSAAAMLDTKQLAQAVVTFLQGGRQTFAQAPPLQSGASGAGTLLFPLIMFAAGPGTITAVVTMAAVHTPSSLPLTALIASVTSAGITFGALLLASQMESRQPKQPSGRHSFMHL